MGASTRLALIGAGRIAQSYVEALADLDDARVTAIVDSRLEAAEALANVLHCPAFDDVSAAIFHRDCFDAALVCTPPATHAEIAVSLLRRGVHVLCEKPLGVSIQEANQILEVAAQHDVLLTMASKFRYVDDVIRAKSVVTSGILGELILFENAFTSRVDMADRWNSDPTVSGGGVLIDNGTHSVDLVRYFLGPITEVMAIEGKRVQRLPVEDTVRLFVRTANEVTGTIDLSWSVDKDLESYIDVYGSEGTIRVGWNQSKFRQRSSSDWIVFGGGYDKLSGIRAQLRNFCRAIRGWEPLLITEEDAISSTLVVDAAYRSLVTGGWVKIPAVTTPGEPHVLDLRRGPERELLSVASGDGHS